MGIAHLKSQLRRQADLLNQFGEKEHDLQRAIVQRDWPAMDAVMPELERLSAMLEGVEHKRYALVNRMKTAAGLSESAPFSDLVATSKPKDRVELTSLYRDLQVAVLRVRNHTNGIDSYVRNSVRTANTVLGELFPERKGTIYSRNGARSPLRGSAMVLNQQL